VTAPALQPTLWRTCRVIANHARLEVFSLLLQEPGLTVSAVAARLKQPLSLTSENLRALEARGLLTARRVGKLVTYSPGDSAANQAVHNMVDALRRAFLREQHPVETIFKMATAFTHPRRIEVFRALQGEARTAAQIQQATAISERAVRRHLWKLESRGFVIYRSGRYAVLNRPDAFGRELVRLAAK